MKLRIAAKVAILVAIEILLIASTFGYLAYVEAQNLLIGNSINIAGKNRFLTATVMLHTEFYLSGHGENSAVESSLENLESNILLLRDGGVVGGIAVGGLPPSFIDEWQTVYSNYSEFRAETRALISDTPAAGRLDNTIAQVVSGNMLIESSDSLVTALGIYANFNASQLLTSQILLGVLNIGVHLFMLYLILKILKPIILLTKKVNDVRDGDLGTLVPVVGNDELRELSESFNSMIKSLKQSSIALSAEKKKYQHLYDSAPDLYRVENLDGIVLDCNQSYVDSLKYSTKEELIGKSIFDTTAESSIDAMRQGFEECKKTGTIANKEIWLKRKDGSTFPALISATSIFDENGVLVGINTGIIDATEIFESRKKVEEANARLRELDAMKSEFISVAAHELGTPIQPILGIARLASTGAISNEEAWRIVTKEATRLKDLASDMLDITRIEGGDIALSKERFCVNDLIRDLAPDGRFSMKEQVQINLDLGRDADMQIEADKSRLAQVITNLLSNAVKFTKKGSIIISTKTIYSRRYMEIFVSDTGAGIPAEIMPRLFTKFATRSVAAGTQHGTGLGLYICKEIVQAHGGSISGYNNDTGGATFRILLPASNLPSTTDSRAAHAQ